MKRVFLIAVVLFSWQYILAQDVIATDSTLVPAEQTSIYRAMEDNVTIHADKAIFRLLQDKITGRERAAVKIQGYRVQIYSSNNQQVAKQEAFALEKRIVDSGLSVPIYVTYSQPFWKVRLGNFRTQEEANELKMEIIRNFPDLQAETYIVREQIQVVE